MLVLAAPAPTARLVLHPPWPPQPKGLTRHHLHFPAPRCGHAHGLEPSRRSLSLQPHVGACRHRTRLQSKPRHAWHLCSVSLPLCPWPPPGHLRTLVVGTFAKPERATLQSPHTPPRPLSAAAGVLLLLRQALSPLPAASSPLLAERQLRRPRGRQARQAHQGLPRYLGARTAPRSSSRSLRCTVGNGLRCPAG